MPATIRMMLFLSNVSCLSVRQPPLTAEEARAEVRQAEIAFAKAFVDRDPNLFFSFVDPDAVFLSRSGELRGRDAVIAEWTRFFAAPVAPFRWEPQRVEVNGARDLGLSIGPIFDAAGKQIGTYVSTWQRQRDGRWRVIFDGAPPSTDRTVE